MREFPDTVIRMPGAHRAQNGGTFDYKGVNDQAELDAALADGWHLTFDDAYAACAADDAEDALDAAEALEDAIDDVSPAARDELEQRAKELGVPFNKRTSDEVLIQRIADAS